MFYAFSILSCARKDKTCESFLLICSELERALGILKDLSHLFMRIVHITRRVFQTFLNLFKFFLTHGNPFCFFCFSLLFLLSGGEIGSRCIVYTCKAKFVPFILVA